MRRVALAAAFASVLCGGGVCGSSVWAEDAPQPVLRRLYTRLLPVFHRYYPQASSRLTPSSFEFAYDTRTFLIHEQLKTGEWQDAHEVRGPNRRGILCKVELHTGKYEGPLELPREFDERYFRTLVSAMEPADQPDQPFHALVRLFFPDTVDAAFMVEFNVTVEEAFGVRPGR